MLGRIQPQDQKVCSLLQLTLDSTSTQFLRVAFLVFKDSKGRFHEMLIATYCDTPNSFRNLYWHPRDTLSRHQPRTYDHLHDKKHYGRNKLNLSYPTVLQVLVCGSELLNLCIFITTMTTQKVPGFCWLARRREVVCGTGAVGNPCGIVQSSRVSNAISVNYQYPFCAGLL